MRLRTGIVILIAVMSLAAVGASSDNLCKNSDFTQHSSDGRPAGYSLSGNVEYRYLGDPVKDSSGWGIALKSLQGGAGSVTQTVDGIKAENGRWFRFSFRGLPQRNFSVGENGLFMTAKFYGDHGKISYDAKEKQLYDQVEQARKDLSVNGVHHQNGAEVWQTYQMDFYLPFPQVTQVQLSVGFDHGLTKQPAASEFFVTDFLLVSIPTPADEPEAAMQPALAILPAGHLIPIGGRWSYMAKPGETQVPGVFNQANADRLVYHDAIDSAPFANNTVAWLRAGDEDLQGNIVYKDRLIDDNVTITFTADAMVVHTHGLPNHPTAKFPLSSGTDRNPSHIKEQNETFYIPLNPQENPRHFSTTANNSNHALPMGPIGVATNGVVFFNPFDMGNQDATDLMDSCCGHPNQFGQYHYHKYPICLNSPWADDGKEHSPLIGWAFDGYPVYGPYESADVMAKDLKGDRALNAFNMHYDPERGWHYHVTPGEFPYIIGGYWGTEDARDGQHPRPRNGQGNGPGNGQGNGPGNGMRPPGGPGDGNMPPFPPPF